MQLNLLGNNMSDRAWLRRWTMLAAGLATLAGTAISIAQNAPVPVQPPTPPPAQDGSFDRPLNGDAGDEERDANQAQVRGRSTSSVTINENGKTYSVQAVDGVITRVEVDGKVVPKNRYRHQEGKLEILDIDGNVEKSIDIELNGRGIGFGPGVRTRVFNGEAARRQGGQEPREVENRQRGRQDALRGLALAEPERPKVMLGITFSEVEDGGDGVVVDSIIEGLPAHSAGIREGDVILKVGKDEVLGNGTFRGLLRKFNAGDQADFTIVRDGQQKIVTVGFVAYDGQRLGQLNAMGELPVWPEGQWNMQGLDKMGEEMNRAFGEDFAKRFRLQMGDTSEVRQALEEARNELREAMEELREAAATELDAVRTEANNQLQNALDQLEKASALLAAKGQRHFWGEGQNGEVLVVPVQPVPPVAPVAPIAPRGRANRNDGTASEELRLLREQLQRMEERMKELEKR